MELLSLAGLLLLLALCLAFIFWRSTSQSPGSENSHPIEGEAEKLFFQSSYGPICYRRHGTVGQPNLVLLHGIGSSMFSWRLLIPELDEHFHIMSLDLWGFGESAKVPQTTATLEVHQTILNELLAELNIETYHLVGCSMGGAIALWLASENSFANSPLKKVIALAPAAGKGLVPKITGSFGWLAHLTPALINKSLIAKILKRIYGPEMIFGSDVVKAYLRPYKEKVSHQTFAQHLKLLQDPRIIHNLSRVNHQTLVLYGHHDKIVPEKVTLGVIEQVPHCIYHEHPSAGHHLMEEDPRWCADHIVSFLKT